MERNETYGVCIPEPGILEAFLVRGPDAVERHLKRQIAVYAEGAALALLRDLMAGRKPLGDFEFLIRVKAQPRGTAQAEGLIS